MKKLIAASLVMCMLYACKKNDPPPNTIPPVTSKSPSITSVSPITGGYNTVITITGTNFSTAITNNHVTVNGIVAAIQSATNKTITALVPERAGTGNVVVTTDDGTSNGTIFTYVPNVFVVWGELKGNMIEAKYWKNDVPTILSDHSRVNDIFVSGNDVYACGFERDTISGRNTPIYWKNGIGNTLPITSTSSGSAESIFIVGNDVYVAGGELTSSLTSVASYWKNGVLTTLSDSTNSIHAAYSIFVSGNDTYVVGNKFNSVGGFGASNTTGKFWKNGIETPLTNTPNFISSANSVFVSGNDVYIAGSESSGSTSTAKYWKNNVEIRLNSINSGRATDIFVSGNDVYVVGDEYVGGGKNAIVYWKNGNKIIVTDGSISSYANSIQVNGNDVYVSGYELGVISPVMYWKNGTKITLTDGTNSTYTGSLFLQ